jgi:hypothetical protein
MPLFPLVSWPSPLPRKQSISPTSSLWRTRRRKRRSSSSRYLVERQADSRYCVVLTSISQVTGKKSPPPGFEFVPIGNPELTSACKELSRDKDAMIFIVSDVKDASSAILSHQVHRIGHHIRQTIVEEARGYIQQPDDAARATDGKPEPIPASQAEYNQQVDAAIRDLFPRVPNTDRQAIIEHAFQRVCLIFQSICYTAQAEADPFVGRQIQGRQTCWTRRGHNTRSQSPVGGSGAYSPQPHAV